MAKKIIRSELEFSQWFKKNFKKLGYEKILKKDSGKFPDFIMLKKGKGVGIELETLSSNFILHKHDKSKVDEIVCLKKDVDIGVPTLEVKSLRYIPRLERISATIDGDKAKLLDKLLENGKYRNKSHIIEEAIKLILEKENAKKK